MLKEWEIEFNNWLAIQLFKKYKINNTACIYLRHPFPSANYLADQIVADKEQKKYVLYSLTSPMESRLVLQLGERLEEEHMKRLYFCLFPIFQNKLVKLEPIFQRCLIIKGNSYLRHDGSSSITALNIAISQSNLLDANELANHVPRDKTSNEPLFNSIAKLIIKNSKIKLIFHTSNDKKNYISLQNTLEQTMISMKDFINSLLKGKLSVPSGKIIIEGYITYQSITKQIDKILYDQNQKDLCFGRISSINDR